jgi:hypothetical protein
LARDANVLIFSQITIKLNIWIQWQFGDLKDHTTWNAKIPGLSTKQDNYTETVSKLRQKDVILWGISKSKRSFVAHRLIIVLLQWTRAL